MLKSLRRWREEIADEAGVPPHYILSNDTLAELARRRPSTHEELLTVQGIGPVKARRFGLTLLEIVAAADEGGNGKENRGAGQEESHDSTVQRSTPDTQHPSPPTQTSHPSLSSHPSHYWTRRLLSAGFTVEECAAIRGLSRDVVLEHAQRAEHEYEGGGP